MLWTLVKPLAQRITKTTNYRSLSLRFLNFHILFKNDGTFVNYLVSSVITNVRRATLSEEGGYNTGYCK